MARLRKIGKKYGINSSLVLVLRRVQQSSPRLVCVVLSCVTVVVVTVSYDYHFLCWRLLLLRWLLLVPLQLRPGTARSSRRGQTLIETSSSSKGQHQH